MGRLFDAVASLAGVRQVNHHEAEAAVDLEASAGDVLPPYGASPTEAVLAGDAAAAGAYRFGIEPTATGLLVVTWRAVVRAVVADVRAGVAAAVIAARFHAAVAHLVGAVCRHVCGLHGPPVVGLTGGVFQNALLTGATVTILQRAGCDTVLHRCVPPNDGGLALGQAVLARQRLGG
jgi:hydrogenase maturation protein HypF